MVLHIQGSGRLRVMEPDGSPSLVRVAYAGTNDQPHGSIGRWLLDQGYTRDATWPGIRAWLAANPQRTNELMWTNPRYVFFKEEPWLAWTPPSAPRVRRACLTPGAPSRWTARAFLRHARVAGLQRPQVQLSRLVLAQDTGSAILGAVRPTISPAGARRRDIAGRLKQNLRLWVLGRAERNPGVHARASAHLLHCCY